MKRVTGIGGVFIKADDPEGMYGWYERHLGIARGSEGVPLFHWRHEADPERRGMTVWSLFARSSEYFGTPEQQVMVNYRVDDLDALLETLAKEGVTIAPERENSEYGRFAWIVDPEGNRIELWEPPPDAGT